MKSAYLTSQNTEEKKKDWLSKLNKKHWKSFDLTKSALLVIDMQRYFTDPASNAFVPSVAAISPNIKTLIKIFKEAKRPIVHTFFATKSKEKDPILTWWGKTVTQGSRDAQLSIKPDAKSLILRKAGYSAFHGTPLNDFLKLNQIQSVLVTGVLTNFCCESTARAAFDHGYGVFFVLDATAAYDETHHLATLQNLSEGFATVLSTQDIQ